MFSGIHREFSWYKAVSSAFHSLERILHMDQIGIPLTAQQVYEAEVNAALDVYNAAQAEMAKVFEENVDRFIVNAVNAARDAYHAVFNAGVEQIMREVDKGMIEEDESKAFEKLRQAAQEAADKQFDEVVEKGRESARQARKTGIDEARKMYLQACTLAESKFMQSGENLM